ncbi:MAG: hypothetical protein QM791_06960 [Ferruginibacter sp.]
MAKKKTIVRWIITSLWVLTGAGVIVLLAAAMHKEDKQVCTGLNVTIHGVSNNFFVDKNDILKAINEYVDGSPVGQPVSFFKLQSLEGELKKNVWVKKAKLFFDNNLVMQVDILEREPIVRLFTTSGNTFYADTACAMLPLSEKFSARLPVFTNFPSDKKVLSKADSSLLRNVVILSEAIQKDSFAMAMIDQVDITPHRMFEMVPKIGNTLISFGDATDVEKKLEKLKLFYTDVMMKSGWNYYTKVDVQYAGQIVAKRKNAEDKTADSLRSLQIMQLIAMDAEMRASDSLQTILQDNEHNTTNVNLIQESFQRDDEGLEFNSNEEPKPQGIPVVNNPVVANPKPVEKKKAATAKPKLTAATPKKTTSNVPVKKPVVTKPAAAKPVVKVMTKPPAASKVPAKPVTQLKPKPAAAKPAPQKPKAVMQKKNDY